jgi:hypothetical protein
MHTIWSTQRVQRAASRALASPEPSIPINNNNNNNGGIENGILKDDDDDMIVGGRRAPSGDAGMFTVHSSYLFCNLNHHYPFLFS